MNTCLRELIPKDPHRLNTIWATQWSSGVLLPLQWQVPAGPALRLAAVGGVNRCGAYCTAWGCGANQTDRWSQSACDVPAPQP